MKPVVIGFGILIACLLILFQLAKFSFMKTDSSPEIWVAVISLVFFGIGVYFSKKYWHRKPEPSANGQVSPEKVEKSGLSKREYEILLLINEGLSNQQIAEKLFLSENTIKKHVSNLFIKLDVERRTEAIRKAKDLGIIA